MVFSLIGQCACRFVGKSAGRVRSIDKPLAVLQRLGHASQGLCDDSCGIACADAFGNSVHEHRGHQLPNTVSSFYGATPLDGAKCFKNHWFVDFGNWYLAEHREDVGLQTLDDVSCVLTSPPVDLQRKPAAGASFERRIMRR